LQVTQRRSKCAFGVEPVRFCRRHDRQQQAAELLFVFDRDRRLLGDIHESELACFAEQFVGEAECGHRLGNAVEHTRTGGLLDLLEVVPESYDIIRGFGCRVSEHVRVSADHLRGHVRGDVFEGEETGLGGDVAVEDDLVENVAKLFEHLVAVAGLDGVDQFVRLFDQVLHERLVGLLTIPGASARRAQLLEYGDEFFELRMLRGLGHASILTPGRAIATPTPPPQADFGASFHIPIVVRENVSGTVFDDAMELLTGPASIHDIAAFAADPAAAVLSAMQEWELTFDTLTEQARAANAAEAAKLVTINIARKQLDRIQAMDPADMRRTNAVRFQTDEAAIRSFRHQVALALGVHEFTAAHRIQCAEVLVEEFTRTLAKLTDGVISLRHAQIMIDVASGVPEEQRLEFEDRVLPKAAMQTANQFERTAKTIRTRLHPETLEDRHLSAMEDREAAVEPGDAAMARYTVTNSATNIYAARDRINRIAQFLHDQDGETRSLRQLRSDVATQLLILGDVYDHIPGTHSAGNADLLASLGEPESASATPQPPRAPSAGRFSAIVPTVHVTVPVLSLLPRREST